MRQIAFLLILLCAIINTYAQSRYILSGVFPNGQNVKENEVLFLNDSCIFSVSDEAGLIQELKSCKWEYNALLKNENQINVSNGNESKFYLNIDSALYKNDYLCSMLKRSTFKGDNSVYYSTYINCSAELPDGQNINLSIPLLLNLLPSIPIIKLKEFAYSNYDSKYHIFDDGKMTLEVISERSFRIAIKHKSPFRPGALIHYCYYDLQDGKQLAIFDFEDADDCLTFWTENENGGVSSNDTIRGWEFIPTLIEQVANESYFDFYPNPAKDILNIKGDLENIILIDIYNNIGQVIKRINYITSTIDISDLANGIYFLSYLERNTQKRKAFKFLKTQ